MSVSDTSADTATATLNVMANSLKSRPMRPPMKSNGINTATSETVPLTSVRGVMLTHVVGSPDTYVPGTLGREITLTIGWGAVARIDIVPATCGDPECDADHGFEGTVASDDISLRISADADGDRALTDALSFARSLSGSIGGPVRS